MKKNGITEYYEEVETKGEYDGYFCSVSEAITTAILGSICGLKNISQINQWATNDRVNRIPRAFVCANDNMAIAVVAELKEHGIAVPEQVAVTGFDCINAVYSSEPTITTAYISPQTTSEAVLRALTDIFAGNFRSGTVELCSSIVINGSCGCAEHKRNNSAMVFFGFNYLADMGTLGTVAVEKTLNEYGLEILTYKDNSLKILLYGVLTIFFIVGMIYTWVINVKQNGLAQELIEKGIRPKAFKDDLKSLADEQYYKTLLAVPLLGIVVFTVIPIFFMILIAFTNYDYSHLPPEKLFSWVGFENFKTMLATDISGSSKFAYTFREILIWTLIWALVATFSNYFLGMFVAICINRKGIKFKKVFRTVLVMTIAVPQFVSLLLVSKMFADEGIVNNILMQLGWISERIGWLSTPDLARIMVLVINLWVGIPYLMLITTGVLMNIPADLYESAKIDGASGIKQFTKITLPYMLFVTGPYLLTSFTANINNFNVIYLLTAGKPKTMAYEGGAGSTDLLITWLYTMTVTNNDYKLAAVVGILVFLVVAAISLVVYNLSPAMKNEEDFQ